MNQIETVNWKHASDHQIPNYLSCTNEGISSLIDADLTTENIIQEVFECLTTFAKQCIHKKSFKCYLKPYWKYINVKDLHTSMRQKRSAWIAQGKP